MTAQIIDDTRTTKAQAMNYTFDGQRWHTSTVDGQLTASTHAELAAKFEGVRTRASKFLGRPVTDDEVERGIPKAPPTQAEVIEKRRAQARLDYAERIRKDAARSPEAARLKAAQQRAEEERVAGLTPAARELETATREANAADARKADEAKAAEIRATRPYTSLRTNLDELLFAARLDSGVSASELQALEDQSAELESTLDIPAIKANVSQLQRVIDGRLDLQAAELRAATDTLAARRKLLAAGQVFDEIDTEIIGDMTFIKLTVDGKSVKISQQKYDSRENDESLRDSLFNEVTTNV